MAQTIVTLCDPHEDDEHKGYPQLVSLDGVHVYVVDLCDEARGELVSPLLALVEEYGRLVPPDELEAIRRAAKPPPGEPKHVCPECGSGPLLRSTLRGHIADEHEPLTLPIVEARLGHTLDGKPLKHYCDRCGGGFSHGQGYNAHKRTDRCKPVNDAARKPAKRASKRAAS